MVSLLKSPSFSKRYKRNKSELQKLLEEMTNEYEKISLQSKMISDFFKHQKEDQNEKENNSIKYSHLQKRIPTPKFKKDLLKVRKRTRISESMTNILSSNRISSKLNKKCIPVFKPMAQIIKEKMVQLDKNFIHSESKANIKIKIGDMNQNLKEPVPFKLGSNRSNRNIPPFIYKKNMNILYNRMKSNELL